MGILEWLFRDLELYSDTAALTFSQGRGRQGKTAQQSQDSHCCYVFQILSPESLVKIQSNTRQGMVVVVYDCNPSYSGGTGERITVRGQPGQKCKTPPEKTNKKEQRGSGMAQVIACLLSKLKALSSILITTKTLTTIDNIY
jgi:hypothetical protein